jgi:hypothetical protein
VIETTVAAVAVAVIVPLMPDEVAEMVAVPSVAAVSLPLASTARDSAFELDQVAVRVMSLVLPSLKLPVAASCCVRPKARLADDGVIVMEVKIALVTETEMEVWAVPVATVTVAEPLAAAWSMPVLLTVRTLGLELVKVADEVTFCELPSVKVAVAIS